MVWPCEVNEGQTTQNGNRFETKRTDSHGKAENMVDGPTEDMCKKKKHDMDRSERHETM
jgi:hypothetical protein